MKKRVVVCVVGLLIIVPSLLWIRSCSLTQSLVSACESGVSEDVRECLRRGASASGVYRSVAGLSTGEPVIVKHVPLHAAANGGHALIVEILLNNGADIDARNESGETALMVACRSNSVETVRTLVDRGANLQLVCVRGRTALQWASGFSSPEIVFILAHKKAPGGKDNLGLTPEDQAKFRSDSSKGKVLEILKPGVEK